MTSPRGYARLIVTHVTVFQSRELNICSRLMSKRSVAACRRLSKSAGRYVAKGFTGSGRSSPGGSSTWFAALILGNDDPTLANGRGFSRTVFLACSDLRCIWMNGMYLRSISPSTTRCLENGCCNFSVTVGPSIGAYYSTLGQLYCITTRRTYVQY